MRRFCESKEGETPALVQGVKLRIGNTKARPTRGVREAARSIREGESSRQRSKGVLTTVTTTWWKGGAERALTPPGWEQPNQDLTRLLKRG